MEWIYVCISVDAWIDGYEFLYLSVFMHICVNQNLYLSMICIDEYYGSI